MASFEMRFGRFPGQAECVFYWWCREAHRPEAFVYCGCTGCWWEQRCIWLLWFYCRQTSQYWIYPKITEFGSGEKIVTKYFSAFRGCKEKLENMNYVDIKNSGIDTFLTIYFKRQIAGYFVWTEEVISSALIMSPIHIPDIEK